MAFGAISRVDKRFENSPETAGRELPVTHCSLRLYFPANANVPTVYTSPKYSCFCTSRGEIVRAGTPFRLPDAGVLDAAVPLNLWTYELVSTLLEALHYR